MFLFASNTTALAMLSGHHYGMRAPIVLTTPLLHIHDDAVANEILKPYFDRNAYDATGPCFDELMSGSQFKWSECCHINGDVANCASLFEDDVCFQDFIPGKFKLDSGDKQWVQCCHSQCSGRLCVESEYCPIKPAHSSDSFSGTSPAMIASFVLLSCLFVSLLCCMAFGYCYKPSNVPSAVAPTVADIESSVSSSPVRLAFVKDSPSTISTEYHYYSSDSSSDFK